MKALPKLLFALTAVAAFSLAYPASVQAVPTTYQYTGNHFTIATGPYTTSDFVTAMITLATPLGPNFSGTVTPTSFKFTDGVQIITTHTATFSFFFFQTGPAGEITAWFFDANFQRGVGGPFSDIQSSTQRTFPVLDVGSIGARFGAAVDDPGTWAVAATPDTGSTLSLMTLTLMALGLVARRFKRAAC